MNAKSLGFFAIGFYAFAVLYFGTHFIVWLGIPQAVHVWICEAGVKLAAILP